MTGETGSDPDGVVDTIPGLLGFGDGWFGTLRDRFDASVDRLTAGQATMARDLNPPVAPRTSGAPRTERGAPAGRGDTGE
jgi:hypothetical protein